MILVIKSQDGLDQISELLSNNGAIFVVHFLSEILFDGFFFFFK